MAAENFKVKKGLEVGTGITANSDGINITGVITATQLVGDGSGLTNVVGSGSGIVVKDEGSAVGTAGTINFVGSGVVATLSAGQATVTISGDSISEGNTKAEVSDSGTDGKFFVETEGTERFSIDSTGDFAFNNCSDSFFNAGGNLTIDYKTNDTIKLRKEIKSTAVNFVLFGAPLNIWNDNDDATTIGFYRGDRIQVGTGASISVNGNIFSAGIVTATQADIGTGGLDVDGQTELDELNVAGIATFKDDVEFHGATGISSVTFDKSSNSFKFVDNAELRLGDSDDLRIFHSGTESIIHDNGDGGLILQSGSSAIEFRHVASPNEVMGKFIPDGAVELYHNGQQKFTTTGSGIEVPDLSVTGVGTIGRVDVNGLVFGTNATTFAAKFPDSARANFGSNNELQISHASNVSRIQSDNDILYLKGLGINFYKGGGSELFAKFVDDEQVEFYYNNGKRLETTGVGASCVGIMSATSFVKTGGTSSQFLMADGSTSAGGGGGGVTVKDEGSALSTTGTTLNFVGSGVVASGTGAEKTITIAGGSSQNVFSTIAVSGQSNVVADSATDTLTFAAGSNVTLTTNAGTDTVTIAAANDNTQLSNEQVQDIVGAMFSSNTETDITATYQDSDGTIDLAVDLSSLNADNLDSGTIPNGRFPTTLPAVSGANLTSLTAGNISGTLATGQIADNAVTFAKMQDVGTGVLIGRNDGGSGDMETLTAAEVRTLLNVADGATVGITTAASNFQVTFEILSTSNNSNGYRFSGPGNDGADPNPDLYLVRGQKYRFIQNAGSHPFEIQSSAGGSAYNTGVTNNGGNSGNIDFNVQHDAPTRLYYQCTSHGGMIGNIYITGGASWQTTDVNTSTTEEIFTLLNVGIGKNNPTEKLDVDGTVKATSFSGSGANLTGIPVLTGSTNNQVVTVTGANALTGESNLVYDGNLGVGDATPEYRLKVYYDNNLADTVGSASTTARFTNRIGNTSNLSFYDRKHQQTGDQTWNGTEKRIEYNIDDNNSKRMWISFYNYQSGVSDNTIRFGEGLDTEWMRIDNGDVGIGVTIPTQKLDVDGTIRFGTSNISSGTHSFTAAAGVAVEADTTAVGSCSAIEYTIFVSHSTNIQSQKVLIMDNGTTAYSQEFSVMSNPNLIATFSADVSGSNVRLLATPEAGIGGATTIKFTKTIIE